MPTTTGSDKRAQSEYRMWYQRFETVAVGGNSTDCAGQWKPTHHIFKGRSQAEAQRKAERFWRNAELGAGSLLCIPVDATIDDYLKKEGD